MTCAPWRSTRIRGVPDSEGEVKLWDVATGELIADLKGHHLTVECVAFSPDGKTLVSAGGREGQPGEIKVWHVGRAARSRLFQRRQDP